jgi:hypothetical protein
MASGGAQREPQGVSVDLYWIPLGAGARSVRFNGVVYEAVAAALGQRERRDIYHSALSIVLPSGHYMVEMTPVPDAFGSSRGVVAEGPVGLRAAGHLRIFRYEVRRWRDGIVPDLSYAVASPFQVTNNPTTAQLVFDLLPLVPTATWGRDELAAGEMWTCNSIISWALATAGVDLATVALPTRARAPGWDAGCVVAARPGRRPSYKQSASSTVACSRPAGGRSHGEQLRVFRTFASTQPIDRVYTVSPYKGGWSLVRPEVARWTPIRLRCAGPTGDDRGRTGLRSREAPDAGAMGVHGRQRSGGPGGIRVE